MDLSNWDLYVGPDEGGKVSKASPSTMESEQHLVTSAADSDADDSEEERLDHLTDLKSFPQTPRHPRRPRRRIVSSRTSSFDLSAPLSVHHTYLKGPGSRIHLYPNDLERIAEYLAPTIRASRDVLQEYARIPLHLTHVLGTNANQPVQKQRDAIYAVYGHYIDELSVSVQVIQQVEWRQPSEYLSALLNMTGINTASSLLVPLVTAGKCSNIVAVSPSTLAQRLRVSNPAPRAHCKYVASFARTHHADVFAWARYADLRVSHLTVHMLGSCLWDTLNLSRTKRFARAIPFVSLLASIIAHASFFRDLSHISVTGVLGRKDLLDSLWDAIPTGTPITGRHLLLDMLVAYPFLDTMPGIVEVGYVDGKMWAGQRSGNLFGLRSVGEWQAMIVRARHGVGQPQVWFVEHGWGM